jgi:undecaprenyl-diphosphatase
MITHSVMRKEQQRGLQMRELRSEWKSFWGYLAFGLAVSLVLLLCLAEFAEEIAEPFITALDAAIMQAFHLNATPGLTHVMETLTWIGSPAVVCALMVIAVTILWFRRRRRESLLLLLAVGGGTILNTALKLYFRRVRPDVSWAILHEHSFSFPSGHSVVAVALYGMTLHLLLRHISAGWQKTAAIVVALALAAGIGLSRIYLGVHYPSDVAAGYFVGGVWVLGVITADWKWQIARSSPQPSGWLSQDPQTESIPAPSTSPDRR